MATTSNFINACQEIGERPRDFFELTRVDLEDLLASRQLSRQHARDLFRQAYKTMQAKPWLEAPMPKRLQQDPLLAFRLAPLTIKTAQQSGYDRSVKFLFDLQDGSQIESVLMPESNRLTLCVSTQVGCRQACVFCHTGRMGLTRDLSAGEIVAQVYSANHWLTAHPEWYAQTRLKPTMRVTNVVFMGMGEPLDNVDAVIKSIQIMMDPYGLALGQRHISVSTAGHLDGLEKLLAALPQVRLAISVHATDAAKRSKIMPINRRWPLSQVLGRVRELVGDKRPVLLQYTLIAGVNDSDAEAAALAAMTYGLDAKVNLIPLNEVGVSKLRAPMPDRIQKFRDALHSRGLRVMVRYSKGQDIAAACGQLVVS